MTKCVNLVQQIRRNLAAIFGQFPHYRFVQPDVHIGAAIERFGIAKFHSEVFAFLKRRIHAEHLHEVDNRLAPVQIATVARINRLEIGNDVDVADGGRR